MLTLNVPVLLASASPRRKQLLQMLNLSFSTASPNCDENITSKIPAEIVMDLALRKNNALKDQYPEHFILSADTLVFLGTQILEKPKSTEEAFQMLKSLSGNTHSVYTGICLRYSAKTVTTYQKTLVSFAHLSDAEINAYIATGSPMDKAGAYGIQDDYGALFIEKIEGDYFNVVGLPLQELYKTLKTEFPEIIAS
jgi:septum formation protein